MRGSSILGMVLMTSETRSHFLTVLSLNHGIMMIVIGQSTRIGGRSRSYVRISRLGRPVYVRNRGRTHLTAPVQLQYLSPQMAQAQSEPLSTARPGLQGTIVDRAHALDSKVVPESTFRRWLAGLEFRGRRTTSRDRGAMRSAEVGRI